MDGTTAQERAQLDLSTLVLEEVVEREEALVPRISAATLERLDAAVKSLEVQAAAFQCEGPSDYSLGDAVIGRIRQMDKLFESIYKPEKEFWQGKKDKVLAEEKKRRPILEMVKKTIGAKMLAWKAADDQRVSAENRAAAETALREAEDRRLAQAEQIAAVATQQGNPAMMKEAVEMLAAPIEDIVPTKVASAVPFGGATRLQKRDGVEVTNIGAALIEIGATLLSQDERCSEELRALLKPFTGPCAAGVLDAEKTREAIAAPLATWARNEFKNRGEKFKMAGVSAGKKDTLG